MAERATPGCGDQARDRRREATQHLLAWLILAFRRPTMATLRELFSVAPAVLLRDAGYRDDGVPDRLPPPEAASLVLDEYATAYIRLFVNSPVTDVAHLTATAYLVEAGLGAQTDYLIALQRELTAAGLARSPDAGDPPDHLTLLLERLYLCHNDAAAGTGAEFARRFLVGWLPQFLARLAAADPPPLYRVAGAVLAAVFQVTAPAFPPPRERPERQKRQKRQERHDGDAAH